MPAKSEAQRKAMAIAEHAPEKLYARNKSLKQMSHEQLHEFASTKEKGLPKKKEHKKPPSGEGVFGGGKSRREIGR